MNDKQDRCIECKRKLNENEFDRCDFCQRLFHTIAIEDLINDPLNNLMYSNKEILVILKCLQYLFEYIDRKEKGL